MKKQKKLRKLQINKFIISKLNKLHMITGGSETLGNTGGDTTDPPKEVFSKDSNCRDCDN